MTSIYDNRHYPAGVPSPYGPRVHAWTGGPFNEGSRFHGPVYTRPQATFPWHERPLWGVDEDIESAKVSLAVSAVYGIGSLAGMIGGAYHGYKRNGDSVGWAIGWALLGGFWPITIPVMIVQGFGERK